MTDAKRFEVKDFGGAHKPDPDLLMLHPCPCENDCPCDKLKAWVAVDKKLTLMEAVCEAVDARYGEHDVLDARKGAAAVLIAAHDALTAYRKEA